jgi:hypothetical protein
LKAFSNIPIKENQSMVNMGWRAKKREEVVLAVSSLERGEREV